MPNEEAHDQDQEGKARTQEKEDHRNGVDRRTVATERRQGGGKALMLFRNKKTGKVYIRTGPALNASNGAGNEKMVVYQSAEGYRYVRNEAEFNDKFEPYEQ